MIASFVRKKKVGDNEKKKGRNESRSYICKMMFIRALYSLIGLHDTIIQYKYFTIEAKALNISKGPLLQATSINLSY